MSGIHTSRFRVCLSVLCGVVPVKMHHVRFPQFRKLILITCVPVSHMGADRCSSSSKQQ